MHSENKSQAGCPYFELVLRANAKHVQYFASFSVPKCLVHYLGADRKPHSRQGQWTVQGSLCSYGCDLCVTHVPFYVAQKVDGSMK